MLLVKNKTKYNIDSIGVYQYTNILDYVFVTLLCN